MQNNSLTTFDQNFRQARDETNEHDDEQLAELDLDLRLEEFELDDYFRGFNND